MVPRDHLARGAGLAFVEQDEVLNNIKQAVMRQHAVEPPIITGEINLNALRRDRDQF